MRLIYEIRKSIPKIMKERHKKMKKIIALILVAVMLAAFAACGITPEETTSSTTSETTVSTTESTTETPVPVPEQKELAEIISAVYEKHPIKISVSTTEVDLATSDADSIAYMASVTSTDKVKEICVSGPMMTPPAYEMVVVRVNDASDAESVAREMLENANPGKWVCVCAEAVRIGVCGDTIMMVMYSAEDADALISTFGEVCGGKLDLTLEK